MKLYAVCSVAAFRASVEVPYIRAKAVIGRFVKRLQISDGVDLPRIEDGDYFAEDYTVYGYTISAFGVEVHKAITDTANVVESIVLKLDRGIIDASAASDSGSLSI